jgi:hypothetical protein
MIMPYTYLPLHKAGSQHTELVILFLMHKDGRLSEFEFLYFERFCFFSIIRQLATRGTHA